MPQVLVGLASTRATVVISGNTASYLPCVYGAGIFVDALGVIHEFRADKFTGLYKSVNRSYDKGATWVRFAVTNRPASIITTAAVRETGVWVCTYLSIWYRSTRLYNYDKSTQFKTPHAKAPFGLYAYIKAKKA